MSEVSEKERRIKRKIKRATLRHMSNSKWRKLFTALHGLPKPYRLIDIKLIGNSRVMSVPLPGPEFEFNDHFGEYAGLSFVPFSHIEYVEISNLIMDNAAVITHLKPYGIWPVEEHDEGLRVVGYEWPPSFIPPDSLL